MNLLKAAFFIAVAVTLLAQSAQASCNGKACNSFKVDNKNYSPSEKRFHATLTNTDPNRKIRLKGCMGSTKSPAPWCWDVSIDRGKSVPVENGVGIDRQAGRRGEAFERLRRGDYQRGVSRRGRCPETSGEASGYKGQHHQRRIRTAAPHGS